jgi:hypothetical protein
MAVKIISLRIKVYGILNTKKRIRERGNTFGVNSSVTYTAFEFKLANAYGGCSSVCKYRSPFAIPIATFIRLIQDRCDPSSPSKRISK